MNPSHSSYHAIVQGMIVDLLPPGSDAATRIFGPGGALDSLGLVNLLADLEFRLDERFHREIVLASDRAMSRTYSPFRDVAALTDFVVELLEEA
jgi:acyl carrier protein